MKTIQILNHPKYATTKIITLNKPEIKNAFNPEMIQELTETFNQLSNDSQTDLIVLKGAGNIFCAGADLNWMKSMVNYNLEQNIQDSNKLWDMFEAITFCNKPVIGVVQGAAYGGALGLMAACDQVLIHSDTQLCFSEVKLGLSPAVISAFVLKKCSDTFVRPYMMNADVFNAETALKIGLAHNIYKNENEIQVSLEKYQSLELKAVAETKKLMNSIFLSQNKTSWDEQKKSTTTVISNLRVGAEAQSRFKKFLEKK